MKKLGLFSKAVKLLACAAIFGAISASAFSEGADYVKLEQPIPNADKTFIKVFSYDCPFCYKYDKSVTPKVVEQLGDAAKFRPFHLKTKGKYGTLASELFAVLVVKDEANGVKNSFADDSLFKKAKMAYYKAYHDKKERWSDGKDPEAFLKVGLDATGLSKADFEAALKDEKVQNLLKEWDASYDVAKIQGVPAFVVNGKYLIYTAKITSIDGMEQLVKELLAK
ncbi:thiol:disulfide interchange protein DsbA/DsbL [Campylobacter californiensis]|uniref:thiol:disulfide interchange protein DsbA/DsbL n=1 Tax=Campylobacter californiensis TaxID=1032243 RepID=UPI0014728A1B|nr:thiol:disulfide interchange protein DsbA/DsbL [Campylobacter sp. RM12916]MBE3610392.1 thiol:disulfide interchange protein DsbA/DsbL [Campylobacter sp. RM12916]